MKLIQSKAAQREGELIEALLEVRGLVESGSEAMGIIDDTLGNFGLEPWKVDLNEH